MRYRSERGFTLIELIVVLLILAVAMSLVVGALGSSRDKAVLRHEAARMRNMLMYAREISLMERLPVSLVPDVERNTFRLEKNGRLFGQIKTLPRGIGISGKAVVFLPKGDSTGGVITLKDKNERGFAIEVDPVTGEAAIRRL